MKRGYVDTMDDREDVEEVERYWRMQLDKHGAGRMNDIGMSLFFLFPHLAFCEVFLLFPSSIFLVFVFLFPFSFSVTQSIPMTDLGFMLFL